MKPKHQRLVFIGFSVAFLCLATLLTMRAFSENLVFFMSPSDVAARPPAATQLMRVGGLVMEGSVEHGEHGDLRFHITDGAHDVAVQFHGMPPNLFGEGQGVIAEGYLEAPREFRAKRILTKHDEKYMPREVVDALKKSGRWQEGGVQ